MRQTCSASSMGPQPRMNCFANSDQQERPKQGVAPQKDRVFNGSPAMDEESANEN